MQRLIVQLFGWLLTLLTRRFYQFLDDPERAQRRVQEEICDRISRSRYGQSLGIQSVQDWHKLPVVDYDDLQDWILPTLQERCSGLTPDPVLFYEKTSGSRGAAKLIPYTKALRQSFSQLFCVWAQDLISNGPRFRTGKIYFCVSPQLGKVEETLTLNPSPVRRGTLRKQWEKGRGDEGNLSQTGLADDSEYLDRWLRWILSPFLVAPPGINRIHDAETFKRQLCLGLVAEAQLEIISIWSPSFLKVHLEWIQTHRDLLIKELRDRTSAQRLDLLNQTPIPWTQLWPELKLISCWDSANSADSAAGLRQQFPGVLVQGKGLLATEAPMTIPLIKAQGFVPVLDQVFFEFEDKAGAVYRLHELEVDQIYTVIISQKGGLYRYRIGDRVRVTHYFHQTPCLEFLGRSGSISDLVGEKLTEDFVRTVLATLPVQTATFKTLTPVCSTPDSQTTAPFYQLLVDQAETNGAAIALALDHALCQSPHYHHARLLGQLDAAQVVVSSTAADEFMHKQITPGTTWGDIKYPLLNLKPIANVNSEFSDTRDAHP